MAYAMLYATHRFVKHWTKAIRSVTQHKSCTRCPNQPDGNLLCPSLFSALRLLAQRSYTNQTNSFPTPPTHQGQARISGCNKSNKNQPEATHSKRYPKLDPVSGKWLLQPAATVNRYPSLTYASNHQSTPKPTSTTTPPN